MATFKVLDKANQYRIEIVGELAGHCVCDVEASWKLALQANLQRQIVVDISRLDGLDSSGRSLLRTMHQHGTLIAASTSLSLVFLDQATSFRRGPAALQEAPSINDQPSSSVNKTRAVAGGK